MLWWTSRQLKADDWKVREAAAKKLGELLDIGSIEALIAALKDNTPRVRHAAAGALVKLGDPSVRPLVSALKGKNADARQAAAAALVKLGDSAVSPLGSALLERDLTVRETAAAALGEIGSAKAMAQLLSALELGDSGAKEAAAAGLVRIGARAVQPLIAKLADHKNRVRETAAAALVRIGRTAIEPLVDAVKDLETRDAAIEALGKIDPNWAQSSSARVAIPAVIESVKQGDGRLRRAAAAALGQIGDPRVLDPLLAALEDPDAGVQEAAALALGERGDPRALASLVTALRRGDNKARKTVAAAIVRISGSIVQPLVEALKSKDAAIREAAAAVMVRLGHSVVEPLVDALWKIDPDWSKAEGAKAAMPQFVSALKDAGSNILKDPKEVLKKVGETRVIKPLAATLKDAQNGLGKAALSLGQIKNTRDVDALGQALGHADPGARKSALDALLEIGRSSEEPLMAALASKNHVIRRAAAHALADRRDARARDVLRCDLMESSEAVILDAAESLLKVGDVVIVQPLLKLLNRFDGSQPESEKGRAHTAKRVVRLLRILLDDHGQALDAEDLEAIAKVKGEGETRFVPSAGPKLEVTGNEKPPGSGPDSHPLEGAREIGELACRELNRRRAKG